MESLYEENDLDYVKTSAHSQVPPPKFADWVPSDNGHSTWKETKTEKKVSLWVITLIFSNGLESQNLCPIFKS